MSRLPLGADGDKIQSGREMFIIVFRSVKFEHWNCNKARGCGSLSVVSGEKSPCLRYLRHWTYPRRWIQSMTFDWFDLSFWCLPQRKITDDPCNKLGEQRLGQQPLMKGLSPPGLDVRSPGTNCEERQRLCANWPIVQWECSTPPPVHWSFIHALWALVERELLMLLNLPDQNDLTIWKIRVAKIGQAAEARERSTGQISFLSFPVLLGRKISLQRTTGL